MGSVKAYHCQTVLMAMKMVQNIIDCELFLSIMLGTIKVSHGKECHVGLWKQLPNWMLRWWY